MDWTCSVFLRDWKHPGAFLLALLAVLAAEAAGGAADFRPPLDKSDYRGYVAVQVNPWFPPSKPPKHALGGPNMPYVGGSDWQKAMDLCAEYGINAFVPEINEPGAWIDVWRELLAEAPKCRADVKVGMSFGFYSASPEAAVASVKKILGPFRKDLDEHPCVLRAGGYPVMIVGNPLKFSPVEWTRIFNALDSALGRMVYLANIRPIAAAKGDAFEREIRNLLPVFDGVTSCGPADIKSQRTCAALLNRIMGEFPKKIYEGGIHSTSTCHHHMGGQEVHLSREWRESVDACCMSMSDSEMVNSLFDHYENSLVLPCYEREDFLLRYLEWALARWRHRDFRKSSEPEIVLANHNTIQLGWENLDFEVMTFPIRSYAKNLSVVLQLCDTSGKVLKEFEPRTMVLDDFRCESYSVPSVEFAGERGVVPRVKYVWQGKESFSDFSPMTLVSPSLRSYHMYWARSTANSLRSVEKSPWTLGGVPAGGTLVTRGGPTMFVSEFVTSGSSGKTQGYARQTIRRDWTEFFSMTDPTRKLDCTQVMDLPNPGVGLHFWHLELENAYGRKAATLPVWTTDGTRLRTVKIPTWIAAEDRVVDLPIEEARVPVWWYPCGSDTRNVLVDESGYMHNGSVNGAGYGGGHLGYMGYNHYHNGTIGTTRRKSTLFRLDPDGRGHLHMDGTDHAMVMGGTAFPGASTYEISVRPSELDSEMGLFGGGNNQIALDVLPGGCVRAARRSENEGPAGTPLEGAPESSEIVSTAKLEVGRWTRLAVVYDLRKLSLYVGGVLQGEVESRPRKGHEWGTHLMIGAKCKWVWEPVDMFKGDIRRIRIYGRNLPPEELLPPEN